MNNIIVCIKNSNDSINEILPGYVKLESNYQKDEIFCWNCSSKCENIKYLPLKYKNDVFYVNGCFCSDECSLRYLYDNYNSKELWEKYQLFKFYIFKTYKHHKTINIPQNRLLLKKFGGNLDIDEYINSNIIYEVNIPSIVIVNNNNKSIKKKDIDFLKLYRKKKNNDTILNKFD